MLWKRLALNFDPSTFTNPQVKPPENDPTKDDCQKPNFCLVLDSGCHRIHNIPTCLCSLDLKPVHPIHGCERNAANSTRPIPMSNSTTGRSGRGSISGIDLGSLTKFNDTSPGKSFSAYGITFLVPLGVFSVVLCFVFGLLLIFWRKPSIFRSKRRPIPSPPSKGSLSRCIEQYVNNPNYRTSSLTGLPSLDRLVEDLEIAVERVTFLEVIGEGYFGKVYKGAYKEMDSSLLEVAIKVLKKGSNLEAEQDFKREIEILANFKHPNIVKLLGVLKGGGEEGTSSMVFEFMAFGDLAQLLRKRSPPVVQVTRLEFREEAHFHPLQPSPVTATYCIHAETSERIKGRQVKDARDETGAETEQEGDEGTKCPLTREELIWISAQVANGMVYLASHHFIHRDIAARNCLVSDDLTVKIADFGMARDVYATDYYTSNGSKPLPIRWMSPEAIKYGRFTLESDVWAYGVVLWEIFSYGVQPFFGLTNKQAMTLTLQGTLLNPPSDCPLFIADLMQSCWKSEAKQRISFPRILDVFIAKCSEEQRKLLLSWKEKDSEEGAEGRDEDYLVPNSVSVV